MVKQTTFFYGWIIVGIGVILMILIYGTRHSFSVFFSPILDEFGWSRGGTALMLSLNLLVYGFVAPIAGSLGDRWRPKTVMIFGVVLLSIAIATCSFATELWHFYVLFGLLVPIGNAFAGWPLLGPALANWFSKRRGLVLGLSMMGSGLSFTYGRFIEFIISQLGWRHSYFVVAGVLACVLLPLYILLFQYHPKSKGTKPYGFREKLIPGDILTEENVQNKNTFPAWTLGKAIKTYQLWLLVASQSFFWGIGCYLMLAHQVRFAEDVGYSSAFAASIFALFGVFMALGELSGFISDWIGREKTNTLATVLVVVAATALILVKDTSQPWLLYIYAICLGYGAGIYLPTYFAAVADLFHGPNYGGIAGLSLTGAGIGGVIGPWLGGYIYDIYGDYFVAFAICIGCFVLSCIVFWIAAPRDALKVRR